MKAPLTDRPPPTRSLKARALQWLAQREQSRIELRRKLLPHALAEDVARATSEQQESVVPAAPMGREAATSTLPSSSAAPASSAAPGPAALAASSAPAAERVDALLDWLEAHRYLSSERFAESRVHARAPRFGNLRIRQELKQHRVPLPPDAARALNESETRRACEVRERKFGPLPSTLTERVRQARFLAGRGFSPDAIGRALRSSGFRPDCDKVPEL